MQSLDLRVFQLSFRVHATNHIVTLDSSRRATPLTIFYTLLMTIERHLMLKLLCNSPDEWGLCLYDIEVNAPWFRSRKLNVSRQILLHLLHFISARTYELACQLDGLHATSKGVIAATESWFTRRSIRSS